jgi:betaine-aldehyde dehydrogenase
MTAAIYSRSLFTAHLTASEVQAVFVWGSQVGRNLLGVPFGSVKESSGGREECLDELLSFTQRRVST